MCPGTELQVIDRNATINANGDASFTFTTNPPILPGRSATSTATNSGGSTSEFSAAVPVSS